MGVVQSHPTLCDPWTVVHQAPLSMEFSRNALPFPPPGDLPNPGIEPMSLASPALAGRFSTTLRLLLSCTIFGYLSVTTITTATTNFSNKRKIHMYVHIHACVHAHTHTYPPNIKYTWKYGQSYNGRLQQHFSAGWTSKFINTLEPLNKCTLLLFFTSLIKVSLLPEPRNQFSNIISLDNFSPFKALFHSVKNVQGGIQIFPVYHPNGSCAKQMYLAKLQPLGASGQWFFRPTKERKLLSVLLWRLNFLRNSFTVKF